jgi:hypothetical protein
VQRLSPHSSREGADVNAAVTTPKLEKSAETALNPGDTRRKRRIIKLFSLRALRGENILANILGFAVYVA